MAKISRNVGSYVLNQVDYLRSSNHGDYDIVCQVTLNGAEICHCTWHPDNTIHCKDRNDNNMSPGQCPCNNSKECLR